MIPVRHTSPHALVARRWPSALAGKVQAWRYGEQIAAIRQQHTDACAVVRTAALKLTNTTGRMPMQPVRRAEARAAQNKRDADRLRAELDGLRGDLADVPDQILPASA